MTTTMTEAKKEQAPRELPVIRPAVDVYEKADALLLVMDMPGVSKDQVHIQIERDVLTVQADQPQEDCEGYQALYRDYEPGSLRRSFSLNREIDREKIEANLQQGVLRLVLPKTAAAQPRKIEVKEE